MIEVLRFLYGRIHRLFIDLVRLINHLLTVVRSVLRGGLNILKATGSVSS